VRGAPLPLDVAAITLGSCPSRAEARLLARTPRAPVRDNGEGEDVFVAQQGLGVWREVEQLDDAGDKVDAVAPERVTVRLRSPPGAVVGEHGPAEDRPVPS